MALTDFQSQYNAAQASSAFQQRVHMAIVKVAIAVQSEALTGLTLPAGFPTMDAAGLHALRSQLAYRVLNSQAQYRDLFVIAVATNGGSFAATNPTDAEIEFSVSSIWNAFALGA